MKKLIFPIFILIAVSCISQRFKKAPDLTINTIDGKVIKLTDFKGKRIIINFWSVNCPACIKELPELVKFYEENKKEIEIIGVAVLSSKKDVEEIIKKYGVNYNVCLDDGKVADLFGGLTFLPTTFIIDEDGYIKIKRVGMKEKSELEKILKSLEDHKKSKEAN